MQQCVYPRRDRWKFFLQNEMDVDYGRTKLIMIVWYIVRRMLWCKHEFYISFYTVGSLLVYELNTLVVQTKQGCLYKKCFTHLNSCTIHYFVV